MRIWYTSDLHFGHVNIMSYAEQRYDYLGVERHGFEPTPDTITEMNEAIVRLWNGQVAPEDHVVLLGDVAMGRVRETLQYVRQLNGTIELVPGNHDRVHPIYHKNTEADAEWTKLYADVGMVNIGIGPHPWTFDGVAAEISHFPYEGDHSQEDRYVEWRPDDHGLPLVHGHVHDIWKTNGRMFNVGIDAWSGRFITAEQIGSYFRSKGFAQ